MGVMKARAREGGSGKFSPSEGLVVAAPVQKVTRRVGRPRQGPAVVASTLKVLELSITISRGGDDVDVALLDTVNRFLKNETMAGKCSLERGGTVFHLHFQMVVRMQAKSVVAVSKLVKRYLGWDIAPPPGGMVMCRALPNKGLHTFVGMLGYCMKDVDAPHFQTIDHNIEAADVAAGIEMYTLFGAEDKQNRVCVNQKKTLERASMFWRYNVRNAGAADFAKTLFLMISSGGKYYPAMSWVAGAQGRALDKNRADAVWRAMISPAIISHADVSAVFFEPHQSTPTSMQPRADWFHERWRKEHRPSPMHSNVLDKLEARKARREEIRAGKVKVFDVDDNSTDDEDISISLLQGCDIPVYSRAKSGLVIR